MAICTASRAVYGCSNASGTTCTKVALTVIEPNATDPTNCPAGVLISKTDYTEFLAQQSNFGWDAAAFDVAWGGGLMLFAIGLGVGLLVSMVRKFRI